MIDTWQKLLRGKLASDNMQTKSRVKLAASTIRRQRLFVSC
jgi:hypothetical protein